MANCKNKNEIINRIYSGHKKIDSFLKNKRKKRKRSKKFKDSKRANKMLQHIRRARILGEGIERHGSGRFLRLGRVK